jgi:hypothetical protein
MKTQRLDPENVSFHLSLHELGTISNGLNEVCHCFRVVDFEAKMGADRREVEHTLDEISDGYDKMKDEGLTEGIVNFSDRELRMIIGALQEVCREIEDWEFHTRIGAELGEAEEILVELITVYQKMKKIG